MEKFGSGRSKTVYTNLYEISPLQQEIMRVIDAWAHQNKRPIAHREVLDRMKKEGVKEPTTILALKVLLAKGYLRRAIAISNKTFYVQLRRV